MLTTVLRMEGYRVEEAANALEGLDLLRRRKYDLVLTDYAMPGGTGTWMLQQAFEDGRLNGTCALVVTAHPELVRPSTGFTVVGKPIELDRFLDQVKRILYRSDSPPPKPRRTGVRPARIELVLYVSSASPASTQAQASMERVLTTFNRADVAYSICELRDNPETAAYDRVVFTP